MKGHHVIIGNLHYKKHSCGRIWISKAVYHICCLYPPFHLQLLPVVSTAICFGFCYTMWEHREMLPLSSESQGGYLLLKMALKHKKDKSQQLQVASLVCVVACVCVCWLVFAECLDVTGEELAPAEVSGSCLCWSEIPKSNKYWRYERTAPSRLPCQGYCLMLAWT